MRQRLGFALLSSLSCAAPAPPEPSPETTDLDRFESEIGFDEAKRWMSLDVRKSVVLETRRRIYFDKRAITQALIEHGGGEGKEAAPMRFAPGTAFIAQSLGENGEILDTEALRIRRAGPPVFLLFDREGRRHFTFAQPNDPPEGPKPDNVPSVCLGCHLGSSYFDPMMSFPSEPAERKVEIDPRYRNLPIVLRFLEGFHRGGKVFGPYGAIWLSKLQTDAKDRKLAAEDRPYFEDLQKRYPEILSTE